MSSASFPTDPSALRRRNATSSQVSRHARSRGLTRRRGQASRASAKLDVLCSWEVQTRPSRPPAVEDRRTDVVSQRLIVKDEVADGIRELFALPAALEPAGALLSSEGRRTRRLDRIGGSTELVCGDMRHHCRLSGCICSVPSGSAQLSSRAHGMATRRPGLRHPDLTRRPCPNVLDRPAGPRVGGPDRFEEVQNVLGARGRPQSEEPMVGVRERPPATDGDETGVAVLWGGSRMNHICGRTCPTG
jgi:hypothetical protein